jgi:uncharacterized protein YcfL
MTGRKKTMKRLFIILALLLTVGCKSTHGFQYIEDKLTYANEMFYHNGEVVAKLASIEVLFNEQEEIRHKITFVLTNEAQNDHAIEIIKIMHEKNSNWEIEVKLKRDE